MTVRTAPALAALAAALLLAAAPGCGADRGSESAPRAAAAAGADGGAVGDGAGRDGAAGAPTGAVPAAPGPGASAEAALAPDEALARLQGRIVEVSKQVTPSVVHIEAIVKVDDRRSEVTGSGVIASADGLVLTNHHVVDNAEKVVVVAPGVPGKLPARIVGTDQQTDLAVLRIAPREGLVPARFGSSSEVEVGQWVLAVGNPYGLDGTVSLGIVSAKGRNLGIPDLLNDFIQTDAMIDRGSSGGPLVDLDGRVIGINSRGQGRGIGFTIPIDTALDVMRRIEAGGIERGFLGVSVQPLDRELADYFGAPDLTGVIVNGVSEGSPAARAGLRPGDILVRFDGREIAAESEEDLGAFQRMVARRAPGETAVIELLRDGALRRVTATLAVAPKVESARAESEAGFHVQEITERLQREQRLPSRQGVYVSFVASGSPAAEAGLGAGDVIRRIEDHEVNDIDDLRRALEAVRPLARFLVVAARGEDTYYALVRRDARPTGPDLPPDTGEASHR